MGFLGLSVGTCISQLSGCEICRSKILSSLLSNWSGKSEAFAMSDIECLFYPSVCPSFLTPACQPGPVEGSFRGRGRAAGLLPTVSGGELERRGHRGGPAGGGAFSRGRWSLGRVTDPHLPDRRPHGTGAGKGCVKTGRGGFVPHMPVVPCGGTGRRIIFALFCFAGISFVLKRNGGPRGDACRSPGLFRFELLPCTCG